jgi:predicted metal-dependent HD superfamily phosphohydrolase
MSDGLTDAWQRYISSDTELLRAVVRRHREKHRRYHTVDHVSAVVGHVNQLIAAEGADGSGQDAGSVIAAALYHDAVYEPASPSNERASARLASRDLTTIGWVSDRIDHVTAMIEGTSSHLDPPDLDTAILFDADLAILGSDPSAYIEYVAGVRAEYHHASDDAWTTGRMAVLQGFLNRETIFATKSGRHSWEQTARSNLANELAELGAAVSSNDGEGGRPVRG